MSVIIKPLDKSEFELIWPFFHDILKAGKTYSYDPDTTLEEGRNIWCAPEKKAYVALVDDVPVGTFYIRANQLGLGDHIANGGFMVSPNHTGKGYGREMAREMVNIAKEMGFYGMQFNFIVEDNGASLHIWKDMGFEVVGTVPDAMRHSEKGYTPVHILYRKL